MAYQFFARYKKQGLRGGTGLIITVALVIALVVMMGINFWYRPAVYAADVITKDLTFLSEVMTRIDQRCKIKSFDFQKNPINFLTIGSFKSSELGSMNLSYPDLWEGPYVNDNPSTQGIEYQIVVTKKGYFITPGDGVKLPNGKVIGLDLILDENADIEALSRDEQALMYKGVSLAVPFTLSTTELQKVLLEGVGRLGDDMVLKQRPEVGLRMAMH